MPTEWELFGSSDGNSWILIDVRTEQGDWQNPEQRVFQISDPGEYAYYRFVFLTPNSPVLRIQDIWLLKTQGVLFAPAQMTTVHDPKTKVTGIKEAGEAVSAAP